MFVLDPSQVLETHGCVNLPFIYFLRNLFQERRGHRGTLVPYTNKSMRIITEVIFFPNQYNSIKFLVIFLVYSF